MDRKNVRPGSGGEAGDDGRCMVDMVYFGDQLILTQAQRFTALPSKCAWASLTPHQAGYATWNSTHRMREDWATHPTKPSQDCWILP